jgi:hypothetical protein
MHRAVTFSRYLTVLQALVRARRGDVGAETAAYSRWLEQFKPMAPPGAMTAMGPLLTGPIVFLGAPPAAPKRRMTAEASTDEAL